jgi:hypothetical protein
MPSPGTAEMARTVRSRKTTRVFMLINILHRGFLIKISIHWSLYINLKTISYSYK